MLEIAIYVNVECLKERWSRSTDAYRMYSVEYFNVLWASAIVNLSKLAALIIVQFREAPITALSARAGVVRLAAVIWSNELVLPKPTDWRGKFSLDMVFKGLYYDVCKREKLMLSLTSKLPCLWTSALRHEQTLGFELDSWYTKPILRKLKEISHLVV